jgi:hypothetical protein
MFTRAASQQTAAAAMAPLFGKQYRLIMGVTLALH